MAEEDEIDILGDFSFNSCFAQNNQGIPSCSDREDTVHPQWLLDSVSTNWYDNQTKDSAREHEGPSRRLTGNKLAEKYNGEIHTAWKPEEKVLLVKEMAKYGRNVRKISQTLKTKTEAEIQALIEAEYGVHLETPTFGLDKHMDHGDTPTVVQEEIVTDDMNVLNMVATGAPTVSLPKKPFRKKPSKNSLLRPDALMNSKNCHLEINPSEIFYEDEMIIGSTESVGSDMDSMDILSQKMAKQQKEKVKAMKKIGNHRRKVSRNYDRGKRNSSKDATMKSPLLGRQRKDSSLSEDSTKSPKMQIVLGSGQALPVSEGEQVIKIEKKKDSDPESDIEVDIDSDDGSSTKKNVAEDKTIKEEPIAVPLRKLQPMPKRQKKINLSGDGGYTIMHTAAGDLYEIGAEPRRERRERAPRRQPVHLVQCRLYTADKPAPYSVCVSVSCLVSMDAHAHSSRAEVMGLCGGRVAGVGGAGAGEGAGRRVTLARYAPARARAGDTHCDMDPVSQAVAAESLRSQSLVVCAWHHSHPRFPPAPSALDLRSQRALQRALEPHSPLLGLITSQHWPHGRTATQYRCIRVEDSDESDEPVGYQLSVKLLPDLTADNLPDFLSELRAILRDNSDRNEYTVDMLNDVCPQAGITYLEKCVSSTAHHMRSAGYEDDNPVTVRLLQGIKDIFR